MNKYISLYLYILLAYLISFENGFLFSVIIAIYNTGRYLDDSIGSLLNQTINFHKIQVILINDESTDDTEKICFNYIDLYPKNIIYTKINHSGVSKARNVGMKYAVGKYANFLDPDDKWDYQAFKNFLLFFKYYKQIDFVAGRLKFFEAKENYHPLDYKYYKSRVVNLTNEYNCIHLSASSCIFKQSLIKDKSFEEGVFSGEDARFVLNILLTNPMMGIIRESIYYYRRRADSSSVVQSQKQMIDFYFETLKSVSYYLINSSKSLFNMIVPFIKFYIGYDILFRIQSEAYKYLNSKNLKKYSIMIEELLNLIEDKYILEQKIVSNKYKIFALSKKYKRDLRNDFSFDNNSFTYLDNMIINLQTENNIIIWRILDIKNNTLHLEGKVNFWLPREKYYFFCKYENKKFFPTFFEYSNYDFITMYGIVEKGRIITFDIFLESISIYISELKKQNKHKIIKLRKKYISYRSKIKKKKKVEIWLINDRRNEAGDNGEYFFRYLKHKKPKGIKYYFIIEKDSLDYKRLIKLGNIIDLNSEKYLNMFLKSDKIISSTSNNWVDNPFNSDQKYLRDLFNFTIIFLQSGIIKDDLSIYLNKYIKNYNLFITSSKKEYYSVLKSNYGYSKNEIVLTGLSRFDNLERFRKINNNGKIILIIPTWRMNIKGTLTKFTYESFYSKIFISTDFYKFYNKLINDNTLLAIMKDYGYQGIFCLHPYFESQWIDFKQNEIFSILKKCDYQKLILESSLLITDYSSIFFDFGYLKKPIIYSQFDIEEYRKTHYKKGFFDYNTNGFGPVCKDIQCTIYEIISEIKSNCILKEKYSKRIKKFFIFSDENNNERIYQAILNNQNNKLVNYKNYLYIFFSFILFKLFFKLIKKN